MLRTIKTLGCKRKVLPQDSIQETPRIYKDLPVGLCYLGTDLRFVHMNDWLAEMSGIPAEEQLGRMIGELIPDVAAGVEAQFRQVIDTGKPIIRGTVEAETPAQPGIKRYFQRSYYPVRSDDGEVIGISCVFEDVTVRNEALAALQQADDVLEQRVQERTAELQKISESLNQEISQRKRAEAALRESHDSLELRVRERTAKLDEASGDLKTEIAERQLVVEAWAKQQAELANQVKTEFLANIIHELRTPLTALSGFSEMIRGETLGLVGNPKYVEYVTDIHEAGSHLLDLINDILDLAKTEAGKTELDETTIDVSRLLRSCLTLVRERAETGDVEIDLDVAPNLPALRADERRLKQILINLLSNAIKFTPAGGRVTVRSWCREDDGYVVQITDTGIGIALEDIPIALAPFGQIDSDLNRKYEGTGLGLPLTKSLVEIQGGSLDLQSAIGHGTTVTVRFPAERIVASLDNSDSSGVDDRAAS